MKIKFIGVGGAFAGISKGNSNMMFIADNGKKLMLDFGTTAPYILRDEMGIDFRDIDGVYISHLHADHIGGLEMLAFSRFFMPKIGDDGKPVRPKLYCEPSLMRELWETSLRGGLESIQGKVMHLTDYFECVTVPVNKKFIWENHRFYPVQTIHVMSGFMIKNSFGLMVKTGTLDMKDQPGTFITTDTQFAPHQLTDFYNLAYTIFHDCETLNGVKSGVHAHYDDLRTLPAHVKKRMWLYHYGDKINTVLADGFAGFVEKGQEFDLI